MAKAPRKLPGSVVWLKQVHQASCHASQASPIAQDWALSFFIVMDSANMLAAWKVQRAHNFIVYLFILVCCCSILPVLSAKPATKLLRALYHVSRRSLQARWNKISATGTTRKMLCAISETYSFLQSFLRPCWKKKNISALPRHSDAHGRVFFLKHNQSNDNKA